MFKKVFSFIFIKQIKSNFNFYINIFNFIKNKKIYFYYKNYLTYYISVFNSIKVKLISFKELNLIKVSYILFFNKLFLIIFFIDFILIFFI